MLDACPSMCSVYHEDDGNTQVLYFENAVATFCSFAADPETVKF